MSTSDRKDSLLEFPCTFPLKVIGLADDGLAQAVLEIVLRYAPDFEGASMEMRPSSGGKYLGLTCVIEASSREQLDALYGDLTRHRLVKIVL